MTDEKDEHDNPLIVEIGDFSFSFAAYRNIEAGETLQDNVMERLASVVQAIDAVEEKTGITLSREIALHGDKYAAIDHIGKLRLSLNEIMNDNASLSMIKSILYHEIAHLYYDDLGSFLLMSLVDNHTHSFELMASLYDEDPELLYSVIGHHYRINDGVDVLEKYVGEFKTAIEQNVAPVMESSNNLHAGTTKILLDMYGEGKIRKSLLTMVNQAQGVPRTLNDPFSKYLQETYNAKDDCSAEGVTRMQEIKQKLIPLATDNSTSEQLSDANKRRVDDMVDSKVKPLLAMVEEIKKLAQRYSMAAEFRCDDFAVAMADDPHDPLGWMSDSYQEEGLDVEVSDAKKSGEVLMHPPMLMRLTRAETFADMVERARERDPNVDALSLLETGTHTAKYLAQESLRRVIRHQPERTI